jgi:hypothetical protein
MQSLVSKPWMKIAGIGVVLSLAAGLFVPFGFPWVGLAWFALVMLVARTISGHSAQSVAQVVYDVERDPLAPAAKRLRRG